MQKAITADRNILQQLITAYKAGRPVDLNNIVKHELMPVPLALANMNGSLLSENSKSKLSDILTEGICTPPSITLQGTSTLVIDVQAFSLEVCINWCGYIWSELFAYTY